MIIRLKAFSAGGAPDGLTQYFNVSKGSAAVSLKGGAETFFNLLFLEYRLWAHMFQPGASVRLPHAEGARQVSICNTLHMNNVGVHSYIFAEVISIYIK